MERRAFIGGIAGGVLTAPLAARAQQPGKIYRIGLLRVGTIPLSDAFWTAMRELGWIEGRNVRVEPRHANSDDQLATLAAELVQSKVDLVMTEGTAAARAAKQATKSIPIVFGLGLDPIESGLVANMARPGENITGLVAGLYDDKLLQILKEALPGVSRVAYPTLYVKDRNQVIRSAAKALGVQVQAIDLRRADDIDSFYAAARKSGADAVMISNIVNLVPHLARIGSESFRTSLPAISPWHVHDPGADASQPRFLRASARRLHRVLAAHAARRALHRQGGPAGLAGERFAGSVATRARRAAHPHRRSDLAFRQISRLPVRERGEDAREHRHELSRVSELYGRPVGL